MLQFANQFEHHFGGPQTASATVVLIPWESAIGTLQLLQSTHNLLVLGAHLLLVEQVNEFRHTKGLAVGLVHPWRCQQVGNLQVLIFFEH